MNAVSVVVGTAVAVMARRIKPERGVVNFILNY